MQVQLELLSNVRRLNNYQSQKNVENNKNTNLFATSVINSFNSAQAIKMNNFNYAKTISFGASLGESFDNHTKPMTIYGEKAGSVTDVNQLLFDTNRDRRQDTDKASSMSKVDKRFFKISTDSLGDKTLKGTQDVRFEIAVRDEDATDIRSRSLDLLQDTNITITPVNSDGLGTKERVYVVNTKGNKGDNFVSVIEDDRNVLMTNAGEVTKKDQTTGRLHVHAKQKEKHKKTEDGSQPLEKENVFMPFEIAPFEVQQRQPMPSIGTGSEIVIGMQEGRFTKEIIKSIMDFEKKINNGEIVLKQFVAAPNADKVKIAMLAGGFGSRAEYTNASSDQILHGEIDGAISTKGVFRTATGLTPMETSFISLHNAGYLDCSKGVFGIGKNVKFFQNDGVNYGNGFFTIGLQKTMDENDGKAVIVFPNDSMSRTTNAIIAANEAVSSGKAAIAMIAKKINKNDCAETFGVVKLGPENEVLGFKEKPPLKEITSEYIYDDKDNCLTNTFQFVVSDEVFKVLDMFEPFFASANPGDEKRDWSKNYYPIILNLTQKTDKEEIKQALLKPLGVTLEQLEDNRHNISKTIDKAQKLLAGKKFVAIPTDEPWADCGTLNALYYTTMKIASNEFPLEDWERKHVIDCINSKTGLIASSKEQKEEIQQKYKINGQVMVVPRAKAISQEEVASVPVTHKQN